MAQSAQIVNASKLGDFGLRLIGTTDIDGKGTQHEIDQVDPIVLFDYVHISATGESPFRPHPHFGLTAMSFLPDNGEWMAWDSLKGDTKERLQPGGLYYVHAGQPAFHHEFASPATVEAGENVEFVQLVWNAMDEEDVNTVILSPEDVPVVNSGGHVIRVMAGDCFGVESVQPFTHRKIVYAYIQLQGDRPLELEVPGGMNGILFPIEGAIRVNDETVGQHQMMILNQDVGALSIANTTQNLDSRFIFAAGEPVNRPFHKLLGLGGFVIGDTEQTVRAIMEELDGQAEAIKQEVPHYFPARYL